MAPAPQRGRELSKSPRSGAGSAETQMSSGQPTNNPFGSYFAQPVPVVVGGEGQGRITGRRPLSRARSRPPRGRAGRQDVGAPPTSAIPTHDRWLLSTDRP